MQARQRLGIRTTCSAISPAAAFRLMKSGASSAPRRRTQSPVPRRLTGVGEKFNEADLKPVGVGEAVVIPPNTPHYAWAKDGLVVFQETGYGPSATKLMPQ